MTSLPTKKMQFLESFVYVIRQNEIDLAFFKTKREAVEALSNMTRSIQNELTNDYTKILIETRDDKIMVFTQNLGTFVNSNPVKKYTFDVVELQEANLMTDIMKELDI